MIAHGFHASSSLLVWVPCIVVGELENKVDMKQRKSHKHFICLFLDMFLSLLQIIVTIKIKGKSG